MGYKAAFDKKRNFGVEIETLGVGQYELQHALTEWGIQSKIGLYENPEVPYWTITDDGSIRGEDTAEIRSPILVGIDGLAEVRRVLTLLNYLECQVNDSCGFHVHWNAEDYTGKNVLALLRLYAKFEPVIDGLVTFSRRADKNIHCRSLVKDSDLSWIAELDRLENMRALEVALTFDKSHRMKSINVPGAFESRNHKVNINAYCKYGTLEFRHFQGTVDVDEAVNWIVFTQQLVNRAKLASVSKEMSAKPTLGEMLRVLGLVEYQGSADPLVEQSREWLKGKYGSVKKKKELVMA